MDRVQVLEERVAVVESVPHKAKAMVFFRGGFARNNKNRYGDILTDSNADNGGGAADSLAFDALGAIVTTSDLTGNDENGNRDGWYFGAGIEHVLTDDLWGLWGNTEALGEIMFEYKEFDRESLRRAPLPTAAGDSAEAAAGFGSVPSAVCGPGVLNDGVGGAGAYGNCTNTVTVTQFTLTASPKIKFMEGSALRPWIIPVGFGFHVISPPSDGVTYLTVGAMFAAGLEYTVWKDIRIGTDIRYHLTSNATDGVDVGGLTAGAYLGFGF